MNANHTYLQRWQVVLQALYIDGNLYWEWRSCHYRLWLRTLFYNIWWIFNTNIIHKDSKNASQKGYLFFKYISKSSMLCRSFNIFGQNITEILCFFEISKEFIQIKVWCFISTSDLIDLQMPRRRKYEETFQFPKKSTTRIDASNKGRVVSKALTYE